MKRTGMTDSRVRPWVAGGFLFLVACEGGGGARTRDQQAETDSTAKQVAVDDLTECPKGQLRNFAANEAERHNKNLQVRLAGDISRKHEYHDCQRLVMTDNTLGPIVAMLSKRDLETVKYPEEGATLRAVPVAVIGSWAVNGDVGGEKYDTLGIKSTYSCLYLWKEDGDWASRMASVAVPDDCYDFQNPDRLDGVDLEVEDRGRDGMRVEDIPPVVRWEWDRKNNLHFIGLRCETSWCEIGLSGFKSTGPRHRDPNAPPLPNLGPVNNYHRQRVLKIKGWYDEQFLTVRRAGTSQLTNNLGTAWPHPQLDAAREDTTVFNGDFRPAAYVQVDANYDNAKYRFGRGRNTIELCHEVGNGKCPGVTDAKRDACRMSGQTLDWWARVQRPEGGVDYACVMRFEHDPDDDLAVPAGAVRWYWSDKDEQLWIRCTNGCCLIN